MARTDKGDFCLLGLSNLEFHWLIHWNLVNSFESREDDCHLCHTSAAVLPLVGGSPYGRGIWPFVGSRENVRGKLQNVGEIKFFLTWDWLVIFLRKKVYFLCVLTTWQVKWWNLSPGSSCADIWKYIININSSTASHHSMTDMWQWQFEWMWKLKSEGCEAILDDIHLT